MKRTLLPLAALLSSALHAQYFEQYFDGANTNPNNSVMYSIPADTVSPWMVGVPQKTVFTSAYTQPMALLTDKTEPYAANDTSVCYFKTPMLPWFWGIYAVQWMQKLDYEAGADGGTIEFSGDGINWENAFTSMYTYNFYGFEPANQGTLPDGTPVFTGTDTTWRNVWFCLDLSWMWGTGMDTVHLRFTHLTDGNNTQQDGWMIDNMLASITMAHTLKEPDQEDYITVNPTATNGILRIETHKHDGYHVIEEIEVRDASGRLVQRHGLSPVRFGIDIGRHPPGKYFVRVRTNLDERTVPVVLSKE